MLQKTDGVVKSWQSRDMGNIGHKTQITGKQSKKQSKNTILTEK